MDTNGWLLQVLVHAADIQERAGAQLLLEAWRFPAQRLALIWADAGYWGAPFADWVQARHGCRVEIVTRAPNGLVNRPAARSSASSQEFVPLARRWVIERTFAWLGSCRRLSKDYEQNPRSSETWIYLAMTKLMLKRLD